MMNQYQNHSKTQPENETKIKYLYQKRSGTTGLSGQLYETKLLSLILLRALYDNNIKEFVLGTNIDGLGAFDDIVLRYENNDSPQAKVIFIQAKHRDDPNKNRLTVEDLKKQNDDFSLQKYLDSYLKIKQKFLTDKNDRMFIGPTKDIECEFIIYTSAKEDFTKKKMLEDSDEGSLIKTNECGKIFQFKYDSQDVEDLVSAIVRSRATQLAKSFSKFILIDHYQNMMSDDLIKTYHVFLAQNVITIETLSKCKQYRNGRFQSAFLTTDDDKLVLIRQVISKEIADMKGMTSPDQQNEVRSVMKSLSFKLPVNFGNTSFHFNGNEKKQQKRLDYLYNIIYKLLSKYSLSNDSNYIFVKVFDETVGPDNIIKSTDLGNYNMAGLVGNLLINDDETKMLKFNINEQSLSNHNVLILQRLKNNFDLSVFRFYINIHNFPKLTLYDREHDRHLVIDFLNKLRFYTNQAKEDEIENDIIKAVDKLLKVQQTQHFQTTDSLFRVKCEGIFLKVHDKVQNWWKNKTKSAPYLRKNCTFYQQAEREIMHSPLLDIIHFIYRAKIKKYFVEFDIEAINCLKLDWFLNSDVRIMVVVSDDIIFTSIKVIQYFNEIQNDIDYLFLDLDFVITVNCLEIVTLALECSATALLVVIIRGCTDLNKLDCVRRLFNKKIIIISHDSYEHDLKITYPPDVILKKDNNNNFSSLSSKIRKLILEERKVIFQGVEVNVDTVFDNGSLDLLSSNLLRKIINDKEVVIGKTLIKASYAKTVECYVERRVCRYITLTYDCCVDLDKNNELFFVADDNTQRVPQGITDVVLITESKQFFEDTCKLNNETNIHWFTSTCEYSDMTWKQSHGTLQSILKITERGLHKDFTIQLNSLKDVQEKVVLISAEPGMGKSTLLTHLAVNTKREHPSLWIIKINLLKHINIFSEWKKCKADISLKTVLAFLYTTVKNNNLKNNEAYKYQISNRKLFSKLVTVNESDEIYLSDYHNKCLPEVDLSEIKLFNYFYNNNNLAVLLDGFDEICPDYTNEVVQLICTLKTSKVAHLWITSRFYNGLDQLESTLGTFSFSLIPLTYFDQLKFLNLMWLSKVDPKYKLNLDCMPVLQVYRIITSALADIDGTFLSIPLHLYMIADIIYETLFSDFIHFIPKKKPSDFKGIENTSNLITLFENFTNMKFFNIRFGDKKHSISFEDPDMRKMRDEEHKRFLRNHKTYAASVVLDKSLVLSENDNQDVLEFIKNIKLGEEKTGIIEYIIDNKPKFVHYTFAEYFAVEFLFDKLRSVSVWKYLIDDILIGSKHGIRRFINSKLQRDQTILTDLKCNEKLMKTVFDTLMAQHSRSATAIDVAIGENFEDISIFLLECVKTCVTKENIHWFIQFISNKPSCTFRWALLHFNVSVVKLILEIIIGIDCNAVRYVLYGQGEPFYTLHNIICHDDIARVVFNLLKPELIVEFFIYSPPSVQSGRVRDPPSVAHYLSRNNDVIKRCWDILLSLNLEQRAKVFYVKDFEGQLPAHLAAKGNNYEFFDAMDALLGREHFRKICTTVDKHGFVPTRRFIVETSFDKLKIILEKVYEEPIVDVKNFVYFILPKLHAIT